MVLRLFWWYHQSFNLVAFKCCKDKKVLEKMPALFPDKDLSFFLSLLAVWYWWCESKVSREYCFLVNYTALNLRCSVKAWCKCNSFKDPIGKTMKDFNTGCFISPCLAVYSDVESDFHAKVPVVFCKDVKRYMSLKRIFNEMPVSTILVYSSCFPALLTRSITVAFS